MNYLYRRNLKNAARLVLMSSFALASMMLTTHSAKAQNKPILAISNSTVFEGDTGDIPASFTLSLSEPSNRPITVTVATKAGTATEGVDYKGGNIKHTFKPGEVNGLIHVMIKGDTLREPNERFHIIATAADGVDHAGKQGMCTIYDNDSVTRDANAMPEISVSNVEISEGDKLNRHANVNINLNKPAKNRINFFFVTKNGSATDGVDYIGARGRGTIEEGKTHTILSFAIIGDTVFERNETFTVEFSNVTNATVNKGTGVVTIMNDYDKQ
jgi:hypothetical protein